MKYSRTAITQLSKWYRQVLIKCAIFNATIFVGFSSAPMVVNASEINQNGVPYKTETTITQNNNIFNISTTTTNSKGDIGVNTFGAFNVSQGDTVNLNLINAQNKLVNLVFDSSASKINGIVNSYKNGEIGGNVLFANPNGFVVGKTGVFNVGSLTLITPTKGFMEDLLSDGLFKSGIDDDTLDSLVTFKLEGSDYLLLGGGVNAAVKLNPAEIKIEGTINSSAGIDIINGGNEINIEDTAQLNANMNFSKNAGKVEAAPKTSVTPSGIQKTDNGLKYKLSMDGGNGITIVSQNQKTNKDYLSAIVNLDGKVNSNGSDVLVQTEIYNSGIKSAQEYDKETKHDVASSSINVKSNADIKGRDVALNARAEVTSINSDLLSYGSNEYLDWLGPNAANFLISNFFHMADIKSSVNIQSGAKITADGTLSAKANTSFVASSFSIFENLAFNYTDVDILTESIIHSGSQITAQNLDVSASTNMQLTSQTLSTNLAEKIADAVDKSFGHGGAYSFNVALLDLTNRAVVEKGVNLDVNNNLTVDAEMYRTYSNTTKNGMLPVVDTNYGTSGIAASLSIGNIINEAIMDSSADLLGTLDVQANYIGATNQTIFATVTQLGESSQTGAAGKIFMFVRDYFKGGSDISYTRANGVFDKLKVAGAIGVAIDNVDNNAKIGDTTDSNKPSIKAGNINLQSSLLDNKSNLYASSSSSNGETSIAGAVAVNIKNLNSTADAYGDFIITGNKNATEGFVIKSNTTVTHGLSYIDWIPDALTWAKNLFGSSGKKDSSDIENINSADARDYISATTKAEDIQEKVNDAGNLNILNAADFNVLGAAQFFNTFASTSANASSKDNQTSAYSGAFTVAINNTLSNAMLHDNSSVLFQSPYSAQNNSLKIDAYTNNQQWAGAAMLGIFGGASARDGDAAGGAISFQWGEPITTAKIGKNVTIFQSDTQKAGDVTVKAYDLSDNINVSVGNGAADESGLSGAISISAIDSGLVEASIGASNQPNAINASNVYVNAQKDLTHINANVALTSAEDAKGIGIALNYADDQVISYIAGNINALNNVNLNAGYEKLFINSAINMGYAKTGTNTPKYGNLSDEEYQANLDKVNEFLDRSEKLKNKRAFIRSLWNLRNANEALANSEYDFTRAINTDKNTAAKAGIVSASMSNTVTKAFIADGANISAGNDVTIHANSKDMFINGALAMAVHGKSGLGGALVVQSTENEVEASIGNAVVDALNNIQINAQEDLKLYTGAMGTAQGSDKAAAGNISVDVQQNKITAAIKDGAKINTKTDNTEQSVQVQANLKNDVIKGVGTISLQTSSNGGHSSIGATLDGDLAFNEINAYIKDSAVNTSKTLDVTAQSDINVITVDAAGSAAFKDSAFSGTLALFASENTENAYIENSAINQTDGRINKGANTTVSASTSFDDLAIVGTVAYGSKSSGDASIRVDSLTDTVNSYIKNSSVDTTGDINLYNKSEFDSLTVSAAGLISQGNVGASGSVSILIGNATQNNYIENSEINTNRLDLNSDAIFKSLAVTGSLTANTSGTALGGSVYVASIDNAINTYVLNSSILSQNDIQLSSDYNTDILNISFGGSGGKGLALSGAVNSIINNSEINTYIKSEKEKKNDIKSQEGKISVQSKNTANIKTINGSISASVGAGAGGAAINAIIDNNDVKAAIEGVNVKTKKDVDVNAISDEKIMSIAVGGAGGTGVAASGSINTIVLDTDVSAHIEDSEIESSEENVIVNAKGTTDLTGGTGNINVSTGAMALGASVVTGIINNAVSAQIKDSKVKAKKNVIVSASENESLGTKDSPFITAAGGYAHGLIGEGVVDTIILKGSANALVSGTKTIDNNVYGVGADNDVSISANSSNTIYTGMGGAGISSAVGIGATVNTILIDKKTNATAENTKINANNILVTAEEKDDFFTTAVAASGSGAAGGSGIINTQAITSNVEAGIKNSVLFAKNNLLSNASAIANMQAITGGLSGSGTVGLGLSFVNNTTKYNLDAYVENTNALFNNLDVNAIADTTYKVSTASGGVAGTGTIVGIENTNTVNNHVKAHATGVLEGERANIQAKDKVLFTDSYSGILGVGGVAGAGGTIEINSVNSTIQAYIGGENVAVNDINLKAEGEQHFDNITAIGFEGGGAFSFSGTALTHLIDTTVEAYVEDNTKITQFETTNGGIKETGIENLKIDAKNSTTITENVGSLSFAGKVAFGPSVAVNKIFNNVKAYTGDNVQINAKNVEISANSENTIGTEDNSALVFSGSIGGLAGVAGSVLYTEIEDTVMAFVGQDNSIKLADDGKLNVLATNTSKINEKIGSAELGTAALGATVGWNTIENTVLSYIGSNTNIIGNNADVIIQAQSNEIIDAYGLVASGGVGSLSGGVLYSSIGKQVDNNLYSDMNSNDQKLFISAQSQAEETLKTAKEKISKADSVYRDAYNKAVATAKEKIGQDSDSRINNLKETADSLFEKTEITKSHSTATEQMGTTSSFIDAWTNLLVRDLDISAQNTNNVKLETSGGSIAGAHIGVSAAISDNNTTVNAFLSNDTSINSESFKLNASSIDVQDIYTLAATGGIINGDGSVTRARSDKTTNTYILQNAEINANADISITANSTSKITAESDTTSFAAVNVGVSTSHAISDGSTMINLADDISLNSQNGHAQIKTQTNENVNAISKASNRGAAAGSGGESVAKINKISGIEIRNGFETNIHGDLALSSVANNNVFSQSDGRAYGGISVGGTSTLAEINQTSGVKIDNSTSQTNIEANNILITSTVKNNTHAETYAGAGTLAGGSGSGATNIIDSTNNIYMGKNYNVLAQGGYTLSADTTNKYKGFNKSDAFGIITAAIPTIRNNVNSTVSVDSEADVVANAGVVLKSLNEILKEAVSEYDLYGGAGGIANVGAGSIKDKLLLTTTTILGGNKAHENAEYGLGGIDISAHNIMNVNEKANLYSAGAIPGADTDSIVEATTHALVNVSNKDIKTKDNHINYAARNDVDIYTKSNVESYGGVAGAGGKSEATLTNQTASVVFEANAKSLSGKDTNISAINNNSLEAYIYAETGGLLSIVAGSAHAHNKESQAKVEINSGAEISSFDKIDVKAISASEKIKARRDALAYELGFIPYHGSGNEYSTDKNSANIMLNGNLESGLGANRTLIINKDGSIDSNSNISVKNEVIGTITSSDINADIQSYTNSKNDMTTAYNEYITNEKTTINTYQNTYNEAERQKNSLENKNIELTDNKNKAEIALNTITNALDDLENIGTQDYETSYGSMTELKTMIDAYNTGGEDSQAYSDALYAVKIKQYDLTQQISQNTAKINENNAAIQTYQSTMSAASNNINQIRASLKETEEKYTADINALEAKIKELEKKQEEIAASNISVYSMLVDDIVIRSGEVNLTGNVTGTGSITAPGNNFIIDIQNKSANNIIYGDLVIDRELKGGIYGTNIPSSITQNIINETVNTKISIVNYVDANDPTVNTTSQAGDIILKGNVENTSGSISIINNTGSILSEGNLKAKDLEIKVPNGGFNQEYASNEIEIGGSNGNGAIVATGNINIAAKTIDVNGLIQSGSEIKEISIPDLSIIKEGDTYYQIINGVKTKMTESQTGEGYYYLTLTDDTNDLAQLKQIKAYFKPTDLSETGYVSGNIYLFKSNIEGGNITLTGNIVSTSNTGKIVLLNGYGHINVTNNSKYNLVTNTLNADINTQGKLTINDFKFSSKDGGATFDNLSQENLTNEFLSSYAGTYEAYVNNGEIITSATGNTEGNGFFGNETSFIERADGAKVYSTTYTPGNDAYTITSAGGTYSYQVYEPRSWLVELFTGKQYKTVTVNYDPVYEVKNNSISIDFQGFDKPEINITSNGNGNILLNNSISAAYGDVNVTSNGSILSNSSTSLISANNITLNTQNNIGETLTEYGSVIKAIQVEILNNGTLTASGKDVYINYPYTEISNISINASGNAYLASSNKNFNGAGKEINIFANSLELRADNIILDTTENENINIDINELKARAKNNISVTNKGDLVISSIVSENNGKVSLESKEGSIIAGNTKTYSPYHITGGEIYLKALNGGIGAKDSALKFAKNGVYNVEAKNDIYLDSIATMYIDTIQSNEGNVALNSTFGIIASSRSDPNKNYNLFAGKDLTLSSTDGNIENLEVKINGAINATAGYNNDQIEGLNSINIQNVSDNDMKIGTIKASKNVTLTSNKGVQNATDTSSIGGEQIAIKASGDIGTQTSSINLTATKGITILSKGESNVYLRSEDISNGLKINKIDTNNGEGALGTVSVESMGNISNASEKSEKTETANINATNISLTAGEGKNIGARDRLFIVSTVSNKIGEGLEYKAEQSFIKGIGDVLNINKGLSVGDAMIDAENNILANNLTSEMGSISVSTHANATLNNISADKELSVYGKDVKVEELKANGILSGVVDNLTVKSSHDLHMGIILGLINDFANSVDITTDMSILNGLSSDDANIFAKNISLTANQTIGQENAVKIDLVDENNITTVANNLVHVNNTGAGANYNKISAKDVIISSDSDVRIQDINTETLSLTTKTSNVSMTGDIKGKGIIKTKDKKIIIGSVKDAPDYSATAQLALIKKPLHLTLDSSNIIKTDALNVLRHSNDVFINKKQYGTSIEDKIQFEVGSLIKNAYYPVINNKMLYPGLNDHRDYITELMNQNNITNQHNDVIDEYNVLEVINQKK